MEISPAAEKCFLRTLSSTAGPLFPEQLQRGAAGTSSDPRQKVQTAAGWNTGPRSGQGQWLLQRLKPWDLTIRPWKAFWVHTSPMATGRLEWTDKFLVDQIQAVGLPGISLTGTSTNRNPTPVRTKKSRHVHLWSFLSATCKNVIVLQREKKFFPYIALIFYATQNRGKGTLRLTCTGVWLQGKGPGFLPSHPAQLQYQPVLWPWAKPFIVCPVLKWQGLVSWMLTSLEHCVDKFKAFSFFLFSEKSFGFILLDLYSKLRMGEDWDNP